MIIRKISAELRDDIDHRGERAKSTGPKTLFWIVVWRGGTRQ
jgi:hypothetical protein